MATSVSHVPHVTSPTTPETTAPPLDDQLDEVADLLELLESIFHREYAEDCVVPFGAARFLEAQCHAAGASLRELAGDLHHAAREVQ